MAQALIEIESSRHIVEVLPLHPFMLTSLQETSKISTTHYSTQIEGNSLRPEADLTAFLEYFCHGMAIAFQKVEAQVVAQTAFPQRTSNSSLHSLLPEQRQVLGYFEKQSVIRSHDVANILGITDRQARAYCQRWLRSGFLQIADPAKRSRRYRLGIWS
jgi:Fic family protein